MSDRILITIFLTTFALVAEPACGLEIEFRYLNSFDARWPQAVAGLERAAGNWESHLSDPVTAWIEIIAESLDGQDAIALTDANPEPASYVEIRAALLEDATSLDDRVTTAHLPTGPYLTFRTRTPFGEAVISSGTQTIHEALAPPRALTKALGLSVSGERDTADGQITWNEFLFDPDFFVPYDYDPTDGVEGLDFVGIAMHEIGHVLGFYSGATEVDLTTLPAGPWGPLDINEYAILRPLDLFRYTTDSLPHSDVSTGGASYFSIDGGVTSLGLFHTGEFNGDGLQADHWKDPVGIMSGKGLSPNQVESLTALDLRAFDVIGWDLRVVPEPRTVVLSAMLLAPLALQPRLGRDNVTLTPLLLVVD